MSLIRDEIRAILREELAALRDGAQGVTTETVRIDSSADLNDFAVTLIARAADPGFAGMVRDGEVRFALAAQAVAAVPARPPVSGSPRRRVPVLDKKLVTEADIAESDPGVLLVSASSRITPLARDEARRKGVRIERIKT